MFIKVDSDPIPGVYPDGRVSSVGSRQTGVGAVRSKSRNRQNIATAADCGPGGGGLGGPLGGGIGGAFGGAGLQNGGLGALSASGFGTGQTGGAGGGGAFSASNNDRYNPIRDYLGDGTIAEEWLPTDAAGLDKMFRLLYHRDIAGTIVDLMAELMWGEFDLMGVKDPAILKIYQDSIESCDVQTLNPMFTRQYCVLGKFVSSFIFDSQRGIFRDIAGYDPDFLRLTPIPIRGFDPKIDLIPSPALRSFVHSMDPRDIDARKVFPDSFIEAVRAAAGGSGGGGYGGGSPMGFSNYGMAAGNNPGAQMPGLPLDPVNTLFVARRVFPHDYIGTSLFTRLITFWALEKALVNATLSSSRRRIRSIAHVTCGIDNLWEPSPAELDNIAGMFIQADDDPAGAVVTTRTGVNINEVRGGTDFYKWSDEWTLLNEGKLRVLGANDALLSGDATYSNQEAAKSFFMERVDNLRDHLTQAIYNRRMFPLLARIHGFRKRSQAEINHRVRINKSPDDIREDSMTQREALEIPESELIMPTISHRKELLLKVNEKKLEIFDKAKEQGLPVTVKAWAAAAGIDLDSWMADLDADAETRKRIEIWRSSYENLVDSAENEAKLQFINQLKSISRVKVNSSLNSDQRPTAQGLENFMFWGQDGSVGGVVSLSNVADLMVAVKQNDPTTLFRGPELRALIQRQLGHPVKAEVAHYVVYRCGLTAIKPRLTPESARIIQAQVQQVLDYHTGHPDLYQLEKIATQEYKALRSMISGDSAAPKKATHEQVKTTIAKAAAVSRMDPIPAASQNVFSGLPLK